MPTSVLHFYVFISEFDAKLQKNQSNVIQFTIIDESTFPQND